MLRSHKRKRPQLNSHHLQLTEAYWKHRSSYVYKNRCLILIAISFFWGIEASDPNSPEYNAFAAMLNEIGGGQAFFLMVPVLAGFIASSIAERPGFAPGMVGGLIAITVTGAEGADGGSGFLGGLIAGFLAGYVTLLVKKVFSKIGR